MKALSRFFVWVSSALVLVACTSAQKRAQEYYAAGDFENAVASYDEAFRKDPSDPEINVGRSKAREKLLEKLLIDVRNARYGGNHEAGLQTLRRVFQLQRDWGFSPKGAVAVTQEEESAESFKYLNRQVGILLEKGFPLRAAFDLETNSLVFQGHTKSGFETLSRRVRDSGRKSCLSLSQEASSSVPYYSEFVRQYCGYWGSVPNSLTVNESWKLSDLFGSVDVSCQVSGLPKDMAVIYTNALSDAFKGSPWYDAKAKRPLRIKISGRYDRDAQTTDEKRVHQYSESVPYTVTEAQARTRQVPYTALEYTCVPQTGGGQNCANLTVTKYRTENYSENVPVVRYRDEVRYHPYSGQTHTQRLALILTGKYQAGNTSRDVGMEEKSEGTCFVHDWDLPKIGLRPSPNTLPDSFDWLRQQAAGYSTKFVASTSELWRNLYCKPPAGKRNNASEGDYALRCLKGGSPEDLPIVDSWTQKTVGVSYKDAQGLLSKATSASKSE